MKYEKIIKKVSPVLSMATVKLGEVAFSGKRVYMYDTRSTFTFIDSYYKPILNY